MTCPLGRRFAYAIGQVAFSALVLAPALLAVPFLVFAAYGVRWADLSFDWTTFVASPIVYSELLLVGSALNFAVFLVAGLGLAAIAPRLVMRLLRPGRTYPLFGAAYGLVAFARAVTNIPIYNTIFGDSSFMVHYLRGIGYRLNKVEQTGSNFGIVQRHDLPTLCNVGSGSMISDGVFISNMTMSGTAFRLEETRIGERNYFGNNLIFPPGVTMGANCLLATKALPPVDGPRREDTGLLGSPARSVRRRGAAAWRARTGSTSAPSRSSSASAGST
jgi:non-ribosomal peptide synthetase-like protein